MLYILLPVHNRKSITEKIILCLKKQTLKEFKIILIDDGSTDGTKEMVKDYFQDVIVLTGNGNWWWGGSLHQGYKWLKKSKISSDSNILILNDDVLFKDNFLKVGVEKLSKNPDALILSQDFDISTGELLDAGTHVDWENFLFTKAERPEDINILSTRGLFFKMKVFEEIGGFHPILIPHYQSDYEFTHRAYRFGFRLLTFPDLRLEEDTTQTGIRNRIKGIKGFLLNHFSKKSNFYQLSWVFFVIFSCPWRWKIKNLIKISIIYRLLFERIHREASFKLFLFRTNRNSLINSLKKISDLKIIKDSQNEKPIGAIESLKVLTKVNGVQYIQFYGWCREPGKELEPAGTILVVRDRKEIIGELTKFKIKRADVVKQFNSNRLLYSGFIGYFTIMENEKLDTIEFFTKPKEKEEIYLLGVTR